MMEKIMLIAGCSHSAGSEIDGTADSDYNRLHCFGSVLAQTMGYRPLNIAINGSTNTGITRSILEWFQTEYRANEMDVFVTVGWTESTRMEIPHDNISQPAKRPSHYERANAFANWFDIAAEQYGRVNFGFVGIANEEQIKIASYQRFMADNQNYLSLQSANMVLQIQYFLRSMNIKYVMCNTINMFVPSAQLNVNIKLIEQACYFNATDNDQSFYTKYKSAGYTNPKATYWHHDEIPHALFAEELFKFIEAQ